MPTNAAYHDPNIGIAFNNLAQMFAPPSAQDSAAYADAALKKQKLGEIAQLFQDAASPGFNKDVFDRQNIAAGNYTPTQGYYSVDSAANTSMVNNAADNARALQTNAADNQRALALPRFSPISQGDIIPAAPSSLASQFGLPELPQINGAPKPLTDAEVKGGLLTQQLPANPPPLTDAQTIALTMGNTPVENVVTPTGPKTVLRTDAVGQEPYFNKGADAKPENAVAQLPDGSTVPAVQQPDGSWSNAQTGAKLPDNIQIYKVPAPTGTADQVGLGKPAQNFIDQQLIDIAIAKDTAVKLRDMIKTAPASQGAVGWLRGTAQNVVETGGELGNFFGGQVKQITDEIRKGAADADLAGQFDPKIPAIDMMANLLAFQYAKTTTGQRLSNEMLKAAKSALGLDGLDANQANSLARLNSAIDQISSQETILKQAKHHGVDTLSSPATDAADTADVPAGWDPEDWKYLTDDEKAQALNGG